MRHVFSLAVLYSLLAGALFVPVQAQPFVVPPADVNAVREHFRFLNQLPPVTDQEDRQAVLLPDGVSNPVRPPRTRVAIPSSEPEVSNPPLMLWFPKGSRVLRGEKLQAALSSFQDYGEVLVYEDWTPITSRDGKAPITIRNQTPTRLSLQAYKQVSLPEHTFQAFEQGLYVYRASVIVDDPRDRRQVAEASHLVMVENFSNVEQQFGVRLPFRAMAAFGNTNFRTGGVASVSVIGSFLSATDEADLGIKQYLLIPGVGQMRLKLGQERTFAEIPVNGGYSGWVDVVYVATDGRGRVSCSTLPQVVLLEPAPRPAQ